VMAFQKHIEIERPSPVSPQHIIALQMDMCVGMPPDLACISTLTNPLVPRTQVPNATTAH
jgi:hypothetical protein